MQAGVSSTITLNIFCNLDDRDIMSIPSATFIEQQADQQRNSHRIKVALNVLAWQSPDSEAMPNVAEETSSSTNPVPAFVKNFSTKGMFLVTCTAFPYRSMFWLRLRVGNKNCYAKVMVKRSVKMYAEGRQYYGYGVEFVHTPQTAEFTATIASYLPASRNGHLHALGNSPHAAYWRA